MRLLLLEIIITDTSNELKKQQLIHILNQLIIFTIVLVKYSKQKNNNSPIGKFKFRFFLKRI
jgi:hypothetical protein